MTKIAQCQWTWRDFWTTSPDLWYDTRALADEMCCYNVMCEVGKLQKSHSPTPCLHRCCKLCLILTLSRESKKNNTRVCAVVMRMCMHYMSLLSLAYAGEQILADPMRLCLPRVNGAGHSVVAMVHGVRSPAVAPHTFRTVVSGHSEVLEKEDPRM